jgi:hypothetical protein
MLALLLCAVLPPLDADPPLTDLCHFPPHDTAHDLYAFACGHVTWLETQSALGGYPAESTALWLDDAKARRAAWDALDDATNAGFSDAHRRSKLRTLRHLLGEEAYRAGRMPCPVPVGRFGRV